MRTAITLGLLHDGTEELLAGRTVNLLDQKALVKKLRSENGGARYHAKYAALSYQESDGHEQIHRFITPELHAEREAEKAAEKTAPAAGTPAAPAGNAGTLPTPDEAPEGDDELALGEAAKSEGLRKELLGKSRSDLMTIATNCKAKLPLLRTKTAIVDAILTTGWTGK